MSIFSDLQGRYQKRDVVVKLIIINVLVFIFINVAMLAMGMRSLDGTAFPLLASSDMQVMLHRPWSLITHMFAHEDFGHILFNMIALYFMGGLLRSMVGSRSVLPVYLIGGLAGYLLFALLFNFSDRYYVAGGSFVLGASAAVMAITIAAATYAPKMQVHLFGAFKLELRWLALGLLLVDLVSMRKGVNSGGHIAHIGGAILGYFYASKLRQGKNIFVGPERFFDWVSGLFKRRKRMKVTVNQARPKSDEQFNLEKKARQERVDIILDKISRSGYDALSRDEKEFLFRSSQK